MTTETRAKILEYVKGRGERPTLIGPLAMALGYRASVDKVEEWVGDLVHEGVLRPLSLTEQRRFGVPHAFLLV